MKAFDAATNTLTVEDVRAKGELHPEVFNLLDEKYPDYAGDRLGHQLGKNGFCYALKDSATGTILGFAAGVVYDSKTEQGKLNTAAFTYVVVKDDDVANTKKLNDGMLADLKTKRNVSAVFVEIYKPGEEYNAERDQADAKMYQDMGLVKVPVAYVQPLESKRAKPVTNLDIHALFTSPLDAKIKTAVTLAHLKAFTESYDAGLKIPRNEQQLATYNTLENYDWGMGTAKPAPGFKQS